MDAALPALDELEMLDGIGDVDVAGCYPAASIALRSNVPAGPTNG